MTHKRPIQYIIFILGVPFLACLLTGYGYAESQIKMWKSQTVCVPIYSYLYMKGDEKFPLDLAVNLVVRNTDAETKITVSSAKYYDSEGVLLKNYLTTPKQLNPLASTCFLIKTGETQGGWGANFIIEWNTANKASEPIVEAVFTGIRGTRSLSFTSRGKAIKGIYE